MKNSIICRATLTVTSEVERLLRHSKPARMTVYDAIGDHVIATMHNLGDDACLVSRTRALGWRHLPDVYFATGNGEIERVSDWSETLHYLWSADGHDVPGVQSSELSPTTFEGCSLLLW